MTTPLIPCFTCKHWRVGTRTCEAFNEETEVKEIPLSIATGAIDPKTGDRETHTEPGKWNDGGIMYETTIDIPANEPVDV